MRLSRTLLLVASTVLGANTLVGQAPPSVTEIDSPNPADFEILAEETPPAFAQLPNAVPAPLAPGSHQMPAAELSPEAQQYRAVVRGLEKNKHQFIHCRLKNGRILTGLVRGDNDQGFTLNTNALGGPFVLYEDLADAPKSVPAVGTRIKQGAQWTGLVALAIAFVPIFLPLMFLGVMSDC